jgi:hypothetical protein
MSEPQPRIAIAIGPFLMGEPHMELAFARAAKSIDNNVYFEADSQPSPMDALGGESLQ